MTVQKDVTKNIYVGNGSTRTFPFTFECPAEHPEYIKVYLMQDDGTALATSDYQLDMDARQITYPSSGAALPEGKKLVIMRELPLQQMMNLVNNGPYFAEDVELAFDENVMAMQQIAEKLNRSIIMSVDIDGDAFVNEVPFEAGKSFRIADDGKSIVLTEDPAKVLPLAQEAYAQAQAQAQSAYSSAAAAAKSEDSAAASASEAGNSAQSASVSAASAAESARLAEGYKNVAEIAKSDASLYAANAKTSADNAGASKEAAQSAANTASNFATSARSSASEAKSYRDAASTYATDAKNYSENVNVFEPSVSADGILSWTNKAGLPNPPSVNIKGEKGDQGLQGVQGDMGAAATIKIGTVTTGAAGSNASVTNRGTANNAVLDFVLPKGKDGADGGVTVDDTLSDTSTNPVQNKVVKTNLDALYNNVIAKIGVVGTKIPTKVSALENDVPYLTQQALAGYVKSVNNVAPDTNGNVSIAVSGGSNITVDDTLSATSTNPVQNKVIKAALDDKAVRDKGNTFSQNNLFLKGVSLLAYRDSDSAIKWYLNPVEQPIAYIDDTTYTGTADKATKDSAGNIITDTYAKKTDISGVVKSVNGVQPDTSGNVTIAVSGGSNVTVDTTLSSTSTNAIQNKAVYAALSGKLDKTGTAEYANKDSAGNVISSTYIKTVNNVKPDTSGNVNISVSGGGSNITVDTTLSATSTNAIQNKAVYAALNNKLDKTGIAAYATRDSSGNIITDTYAKKSEVSGVVKSVNGSKPDASGNVTVAVSGGGVSTSESNTWKAEQIFQYLAIMNEKYSTYAVNVTSDTPVLATMAYTVTGAFTLNLSTLADRLGVGQSSVFTAYFSANGDYPLTITNAGTLKYIGSASDVAIPSTGMLLNILMTKDASGTLTSIVQASKLS